MHQFYKKLEGWFEKLVTYATKIYGNSLTFIIAFVIVLYYVTNPKFYRQDIHDCIKDVILCITFLSFFIIQKSVNRFSVALHLKMNELVAAHENASNKLINVEDKTEQELQELSLHYSTLVEKIKSSGEKAASIDKILDAEEKKEMEEERGESNRGDL